MKTDKRTFIQVHDGLPDHPKIEPLSDAAFRLLVELWCYCSRHLTDGEVSKAAWTKRGTPRARKELLDAGLAITTTEGGVLMHDYLQHQRSAADARAALERKADGLGAKSAGGTLASHNRWHRDRGMPSDECVHCYPDKVVIAQPLSAVSDSVTKTSLSSRNKEEEEEEEKEKEQRQAAPTSSTPDGARSTKRGTRLPEDWKPTEKDLAWAASKKFPAGWRVAQTEKFHLYWGAAAGSNAVKRDWSMTWKGWLIREAERNAPPSSPARENHGGGW